MDQSIGYFESLKDLLNKSRIREEFFWADIRKTGFKQLDKDLGGFRPGELVVIASENDRLLPSLFLQMIETVAITEQRPVLHIRIGKDVRSLVGSWLKRTEADKGWHEDRNNIGETDSHKLSEYAEAPVYVLDAHGYSFQNVSHAINACAKSVNPIGLIVIDGLTHLNVWSGLPDISLEARWADISRELKALALTYQCPVLVDEHVNAYEKDGSRVEGAALRNLAHGGAISTSADHVLILEGVDGVVSGEPADLYSVYSHNGMLCRWMPLRYEHERDRWVEVAGS